MKMMFVASTVLAAALLAPTGAYACMGPNVLYQDGFATIDPAWGNYTNVNAVGGKMVVASQPNNNNLLPNQSNLYADMDFCVDVGQPTDDVTHTWAGMMFWEVDLQNYYAFFVSPSGSAELFRMQNNHSLTPLGWTASPVIKTAKTDTNTLRVITKGAQITMFVNGTQLASLKGFPPQGGGLIGLLGASGSGPVNFSYGNLKITDVPDTPAPAAAVPAPAAQTPAAQTPAAQTPAAQTPAADTPPSK